MKKSLAPPRRERNLASHHTLAQNGSLAKKIAEDRGTSIDKSGTLPHYDKHNVQKYEEKYRNKNINSLSTQMLVTMSGLVTLDISYNKLVDSQIEMLMKSCSKLTTLLMQGNMGTIIPSAIANLKDLVNFSHDWIKIGTRDIYEPAPRLSKLKEISLKPNLVTKVNKIVGIDFLSYCQNVLLIPIDKALLDKIQKCDCTNYARSNMLNLLEDVCKGKIKDREKLPIIQEADQRNLALVGCFSAFNFDDPAPPKFREEQTEPAEAESFKIKIEDIRDLSDKEMTVATHNDSRSEDLDSYTTPGYPLHKLFGNFDRNSSQAPSQIDGLLIQGYNPNQYDHNGMSPYHVCVLHKQKKGLQYLIEICSNNPGFFDLEMLSMKEGRNLLHLAVFLKNYLFTKMLIDFGLPIDKRDGSGARIIHLVDQNTEFRILIRKLIKKRSLVARNISQLVVPISQKKKHYLQHPLRLKQQSRFKIIYSRNDKLIEMYDSATSFRH